MCGIVTSGNRVSSTIINNLEDYHAVSIIHIDNSFNVITGTKENSLFWKAIIVSILVKTHCRSGSKVHQEGKTLSKNHEGKQHDTMLTNFLISIVWHYR
jgi:hypothetical protein